MDYLVGIVGERSYQSQVRRCRAGMVATIVHEPDNPFDADALRVDVAGGTVGYIARDHWLRDAVHVSGKPVAAVVHEVATQRGNSGIVLSVRVGAGAPVATERFVEPSRTPARRAPAAKRKRAASTGLLAMLVKALLKKQR